jgi:hypothetical protein
MAGNTGSVGRIESTRLELFDRVPHEPGTPDDHFNARGSEGLISVRTAVAGKHKCDAFLVHQLGRLNAGAST